MTTGTLVITGAAGFAGGHLLQRSQGAARVVVAWRRPRGSAARAIAGVKWQAIDLTDRDAVIRHVNRLRPNAIIHLAGAPSVRTSWQSAVPHLHINVLGTHYLLEAVRLSGRPCRVLVVSSAQVYQASDSPLGEDAPLLPQSPYGLSKLAQEQLALRAAREDGLDVVVARPFNHVGPGQGAEFALASFARQIAHIEAGLAPSVIRVGNLQTRRDTTDVRDVVDAYLLLAARGRAGRSYNVCSGEAPLMREVLDKLCALASVPVRVEIDPERFRPNDAPVLVGDGSRIKVELGWSPRISLDQTLRDLLDASRAQIREPREPQNLRLLE